MTNGVDDSARAQAGDVAREPAVGECLHGYSIQRKLGEGAFAVVHLGRAVRGGSLAALKVMKRGWRSNGEILARFRSEARPFVAGHPNAVQVLADHTADEIPVIVLEYVEGETLDKALKSRGRFPACIVVEIMEQLASLLTAAAESGVVHRDLKPANMIWNCGLLTVLDYGLCKAKHGSEDAALTQVGVMMGTRPFMSPEALQNTEGVDHRADLWSMCVIVYVLLIGLLPFPAPDELSLLKKICAGRFRRPSEVAPRFADLDPFFERAFHPDIRRRFQTAQEVLDGIKRHLRGEIGGAPDATAVWTGARDQAPPTDGDNEKEGGGEEEAVVPQPPAPPDKRSRWSGVAGGVAGICGLVTLVVAALRTGGGVPSVKEDGGGALPISAVAQPATPTEAHTPAPVDPPIPAPEASASCMTCGMPPNSDGGGSLPLSPPTPQGPPAAPTASARAAPTVLNPAPKAPVAASTAKATQKEERSGGGCGPGREKTSRAKTDGRNCTQLRNPLIWCCAK